MTPLLVALAILLAFLCGAALSAAVLATVAMVNGAKAGEPSK